ncbi:PA14 domain-containing protein [Hymenobacter lucidus]|uniref:OmpA family protein n=1 Tax=Hymenobacter lucidus TaxID=2880930 RepID=A0ABS8AK21_9BACT|nr:PA14 domain-containing protein [Hymenobacter lucidus]MCB2406550.1 OmpA family protein [Hymenobacter lucidus]
MLLRLRIAFLAALLLPVLLLRAQPLPKTPGAGLRGQYYTGQRFEELALTRVDPTIDFNWTLGRPDPDKTTQRFLSPGPGVPAEYFSVRWLGHVYIPVTGRYTFRIVNDDGMRVWLGGKNILDAWRDQPAEESGAEIQLIGGRYYPLRVEYYQVRWDARALLTWQPPTAAEPQPIPTVYLYAVLPPSARPIAAAAAPRPAPQAGSVAPRPAPVVAAKLPAVSAPPPAPRRPPRRRSSSASAPIPAPIPAVLADSSAEVPPDFAGLSKGTTVTLPSLYFTQSTATLLPASRPMLNSLTRKLQEQPALQLEIAGHTDNVGEPAKNLLLSEQRAKVVRRYLVQQGIDSVRLSARGYGGTRPVADNRDPQQRPRNRRVEIVVR